MSQCHDTYEQPPGGRPGLRVVDVPEPEGTACHDLYSVTRQAIATGDSHGCEVREWRQGQVRVLRLSGRLDWATAPELSAHLRRDCADPGVVIDLTGADVDAAGTGALLTAAAEDLHGNRRLVVAVTGTEAEVLQVTGFEALATIAATEAEALAFLRSHGLDTGGGAENPQERGHRAH